jgi:hypothetical protein
MGTPQQFWFIITILQNNLSFSKTNQITLLRTALNMLSPAVPSVNYVIHLICHNAKHGQEQNKLEETSQT